MGHKNNKYIEGYIGEGDRFPKHSDQNLCNNQGYVEGYVDGGERPIDPFSVQNITIEEVIIVPPSGGGGGMLFVQYIGIVSATITDGNIFTPETFSFAPVTKSDIFITINGAAIYPANGASELSISAFYITDSTGTIIRPKGTYLINDQFRWNGSIAGWQIEADDEIKIIYEV